MIENGATDVTLTGISGSSYSQAVVIDANAGETISTSEISTITIDAPHRNKKTEKEQMAK